MARQIHAGALLDRATARELAQSIAAGDHGEMHLYGMEASQRNHLARAREFQARGALADAGAERGRALACQAAINLLQVEMRAMARIARAFEEVS